MVVAYFSGRDLTVLNCCRSHFITIYRNLQWGFIAMDNNFTEEARGIRLRVERKRLGLTQPQASALVGMRVQSWVRFEKGSPLDQDMIEQLQQAGWDMRRVVFGDAPAMPMGDGLEQELLQLLRGVSPEHQAGLMYLARAFALGYPA